MITLQSVNEYYYYKIIATSILHTNHLAGVGSDHAKFQPGMAWYRMLPEVELTREVEGKQADLLQTCFSPGVIDIVTTPNGGLFDLLQSIIVLQPLWITSLILSSLDYDNIFNK